MTKRDEDGLLFSQMRDLLLKAERIQLGFLKAANTVSSEGGLGATGAAGTEAAGLGAAALGPVREIPVNCIESEAAIRIIAAVPGATIDDVQVRIEGNELLLRWERSWGALLQPSLGEQVRLLEIPGGHMERRIPIPTGSALQGVKVCDGLLQIVVNRVNRPV
jgi:HSP20 family molecular chaperone IbpA